MGKHRPVPGLPRLKCLDIEPDADAGKEFAQLVETVNTQPRQRRAKPEQPEPEQKAAPRIRATPPVRQRIPKNPPPRLLSLDIPDPAAVDVPAGMVEAPAGAVANGHGVHHEWQTAPKPLVRVACRADTVAVMYARGQLDEPCFHGARRYQQLCESALLVGLRTQDFEMPMIHVRCQGGDFERVDNRRRATARLRQVEAELAAAFGERGVMLTRAILGLGQTIEAAAKDRGDSRRVTVKWWGGFFRRCLRELATSFGLASPVPPGSRGKGAPPAPRGTRAQAGKGAPAPPGR